MSANREDLTTGPMSSHFIRLAIPAAFGMLFATLYNVVDVYFAGMISTEAQAGLAIGYQAFFFLIAVGFGLSAAMSALVSNAKGAGDLQRARGLCAQGLSYGAISTVTLIILGLWAGPHLINLVSEPGGYRTAAQGYFRWLIFALPGFLMAYCGNGILQAHGDTTSMQRALMVAFFANIGLNPLMIFGIPGFWNGMGFNGIALATVLSQTGVASFVLFKVFRLGTLKHVAAEEFRPDPQCFREITAQLLPVSAALGVMFISGFFVQFALKGFGEDAIAAYGIALRIEQILLLPVLGMTSALLPIAGQNYGAENFNRVREALVFCWKAGFAITLFATPCLWFLGGTAMRMFTADPQVIDIGSSYLKVDGFLFPVYMMLFSINSVLQALKRPVWTLWISIYRQGFGVAFFIWMFISVLDFDVWGVWFGIATAVATGWLMAMTIATTIARAQIGGLLRHSIDVLPEK